mgnify:CR=1 FL=1
MSKKPTKDEALEALDFIINVLREHEKDLDRLINELGDITQRFSKTGEVSDKIEKVEERLSTLQTEISTLINYISTAPPRETVGVPPPTPAHPQPRGPPVAIRCKKWEDFKTLAQNAETVSFLYKETEKTFQVDALKESQVLTYSGEFPTDTRLLKIWLARELNTPEQKIFEGILAIG